MGTYVIITILLSLLGMEIGMATAQGTKFLTSKESHLDKGNSDRHFINQESKGYFYSLESLLNLNKNKNIDLPGVSTSKRKKRRRNNIKTNENKRKATRKNSHRKRNKNKNNSKKSNSKFKKIKRKNGKNKNKNEMKKSSNHRKYIKDPLLRNGHSRQIFLTKDTCYKSGNYKWEWNKASCDPTPDCTRLNGICMSLELCHRERGTRYNCCNGKADETEDPMNCECCVAEECPSFTSDSCRAAGGMCKKDCSEEDTLDESCSDGSSGCKCCNDCVKILSEELSGFEDELNTFFNEWSIILTP
ncbi:unnamed protein product [Meganyctiphanes norvegica]|uniref:Uncharacterized protein n=1 Tax=Meganyctiphanes norvegica TaxID=48144 RepID=A0AAV2R1N6_MEGNR